MPHPKFQMLQDDAAAAAPAAADAGGDVVFPDDYPNSVKHFLMLGAIGFLIGAIVFLTLNFMRVRRSLAHSVSTGTGAQAQARHSHTGTGTGTGTQSHRHRHRHRHTVTGTGMGRVQLEETWGISRSESGVLVSKAGMGKAGRPQPPADIQTQATFRHRAEACKPSTLNPEP